MTKVKLLPLLKISFLLIALNGCAPAVPNIPVCVNLSETNGVCITTLSEEQTNYSGQDWLTLKKNSLVLPADSWSKLKEYILEACAQFKNCDTQTVQKKIELLTIQGD